MAEISVVLLTGDARLRDAVLAVAAAASVTPTVASSVEELAARWDSWSIVVIGVDWAAELSPTFPGRRPEVYLAGGDEDTAELLRWSVPLGAAVLPLPGGAQGLTAALVAAAQPRADQGAVVSLVGGTGGCGTSTLAAATAGVASRRGLRTTLVDLDPWGGGLDLVLGAEHEPGWRWPRLSGVRGHLEDLTDALVDVDGLRLLSMGRSPVPPPELDQVAAVLAASSRFDLTVVDLPRMTSPSIAEVVRRSDLLVLLVRSDVRGLAAAQQVQSALPTPRRTALVARGRGLAPEVLASRSGTTLLGRVPDEAAVRHGAERGHPPGRSPRSALHRVAEQILTMLELV